MCAFSWKIIDMAAIQGNLCFYVSYTHSKQLFTSKPR